METRETGEWGETRETSKDMGDREVRRDAGNKKWRQGRQQWSQGRQVKQEVDTRETGETTWLRELQYIGIYTYIVLFHNSL